MFLALKLFKVLEQILKEKLIKDIKVKKNKIKEMYKIGSFYPRKTISTYLISFT